jgi:hypothetical protein
MGLADSRDPALQRRDRERSSMHRKIFGQNSVGGWYLAAPIEEVSQIGAIGASCILRIRSLHILKNRSRQLFDRQGCW